MLYLDLPESLGTGGRGGRLPQRGPEKDVLLLLVLVTGQKLLLLSMKQPHHVSLTQDTYKTLEKCKIILFALKACKLCAVLPKACTEETKAVKKTQKNTDIPPLEHLPCNR